MHDWGFQLPRIFRARIAFSPDRFPFPMPVSRRPHLRDTFHHAAQPPEGPRRTYLGLLGLLGLGRIDYVFVNDGFRTLRHAVIDDAPGASDHRPVLAELAFAPAAP